MKRIAFLGLALVLGIFVGSCSQPLFPHGGTDGAGGRYFTPDPPQGFENAQGTTVIKQLQWLQTYATSTGSYMVWARLNEPHILGGNDFGIVYNNRDNIRVRIGTVPGIARQTLQLTGNGFMLNVGANNILELENISLQGLAANTAYPVVQVTEGTLRMRANSEIRGNGGAGVLLDDSEFVMNAGASITINMGSGVTAINNSDLIMTAGSIKYNGNSDNGGGVSLIASYFTMSGGVIQSNISNTGGGVSVSDNSYFTMSGGVIQHNTANRGGGVSVSNNSTLAMLDGSLIQRNTSEQGGGGVSLNNSDFTMDGGIIQRNIAFYGGGVDMKHNSTFIMDGGSSIQFNNALQGGGVSLTFDSLSDTLGNKMTMFDASIHANKSTQLGGGVNIFRNGILNMRSSKAVISANESGGSAGGVFRASHPDAVLQISDGIIHGINCGSLRNYSAMRSAGASPTGHAIGGGGSGGGTGEFNGGSSGFNIKTPLLFTRDSYLIVIDGDIQ